MLDVNTLANDNPGTKDAVSVVCLQINITMGFPASD